MLASTMPTQLEMWVLGSPEGIGNCAFDYAVVYKELRSRISNDINNLTI
jgi:hypothetical protein